MNASEWRQLGLVIAAISVVGLSLGMTVPLVSLTLEQRGYDTTLIGIMAAMPSLGILFFSPFMPRVFASIGTRQSLYIAIVVGGSVIFLLPVLDNYAIWLVLRLLMGIADAVIFVLSETWINQLAKEHNRGRLIALYVVVLSLCFGSGPLLIAVTGSQGSLPYIIACLIFYVSALPFFLNRGPVPDISGESSFSVPGFVRIAPTLSAGVLLFAAIDGGMLSLLPVFGLRHGFPETSAAAMITAMVAGNLIVQFPLGWLADRFNRYLLMFICGCCLLLAALLMPFLVIFMPILFWLDLLIIGGTSGGVYTLAMVLVGQRFRGRELVTANAAIGVLWGFGGLIGPPFSGLGMRLLNPDGLPLTWVLLTALFLAVLGYRRLRSG